MLEVEDSGQDHGHQSGNQHGLEEVEEVSHAEDAVAEEQRQAEKAVDHEEVGQIEDGMRGSRVETELHGIQLLTGDTLDGFQSAGQQLLGLLGVIGRAEVVGQVLGRGHRAIRRRLAHV